MEDEFLRGRGCDGVCVFWLQGSIKFGDIQKQQHVEKIQVINIFINKFSWKWYTVQHVTGFTATCVSFILSKIICNLWNGDSHWTHIIIKLSQMFKSWSMCLQTKSFTYCSSISHFSHLSHYHPSMSLITIVRIFKKISGTERKQKVFNWFSLVSKKNV